MKPVNDGSWTCTELRGHLRLFVLVTCARLIWSTSAFESTFNSSIVIVSWHVPQRVQHKSLVKGRRPVQSCHGQTLVRRSQPDVVWHATTEASGRRHHSNHLHHVQIARPLCSHSNSFYWRCCVRHFTHAFLSVRQYCNNITIWSRFGTLLYL